jgi:RNA polymerase sigma factor (sigma-70 family)
MATAQLDAVRKVFDRVRDSAGPGDGDGELLTRYRAGRDQEAFGSLVRRHGPMVLGVCRRVLRDSHAADDAFQATFLVLAKKADAVRPPGRLAPWLYGVAYRTALKARGRAFRRQQVEREYAAEASCREPARDTADLLPVIDEQLNALPEKYRDPLVLCGVQGLNKAEAAERLGLPEGTVSSRLARAREMLRDRLTRRGVAVPAAAFAALFTDTTLRAAVPAKLLACASAAVGSAAVPATILILAHEVTRSMSLLKLQFLGVVALSASLTAGGFFALNADDKKPTGEKPAAVKPDGQKPAKPGEKPATQRDGEKPNKPAPDGEKPTQNKKVRKLSGFVGTVDAKAGTITLLRMGEGGLREDTFKLAADGKVVVDGKEVKLDAVPKGTTAELNIVSFAREGGGFGETSEITVDGAKVVWVVKEAGASTVTLLGGGRTARLPDRVIKLATNAKVVIDGKPAKPTDLQPGDVATIVLNANHAATSVSVGTKRGPGDGDKPGNKPANKPLRFGGKVASVDAAARTLTLAAKGEGGKEMLVKLTPDAKVTIDGKDAKIDDLKPGMTASFNLVSAKDGQLREANEVVVAGPTFGGTVKQIDATTVTIGNEKFGRVLKLAPGGKVTVNGKKDAKLSDLKAGDRVTVTMTSDESAAVLIVAGEKRADGDKPKPGKGDGEG